MIGVDRERRGFFVMKGAQAGVPVAEPAQTDVIRRDADDIDLRLQFLGEIHGALFIVTKARGQRGKWPGGARGQ
jgi:hypothetical protein